MGKPCPLPMGRAILRGALAHSDARLTIVDSKGGGKIEFSAAGDILNEGTLVMDGIEVVTKARGE